MFVFKFNYNEKQLELACNEFSEIKLVIDNAVCKSWDVKLGLNELNITNYGDFYRVADCYNGKILRSFNCGFDGDTITIYSAENNGRKFKAEKFLRQYSQCAMRICALIKCGKIN